MILYPYDKIKVTKEARCTPRTYSSWRLELAHLARIAENIISGKTRKEKTTSTTEREGQNCAPKKEPSWPQGLTKLARLAEEFTYGKNSEKTETNKTGQKRPHPRAPP